MQRFAPWIAISCMGCGSPDVVGSWQGTEINRYTLVDGGGVADPVDTTYPVVDATGEDRFGMVFTPATLEFATRRFEGEEMVDSEVQVFEWRGTDSVSLEATGDFAGDAFTCNTVAGPDTLVCNETTDVGLDTEVISYRLTRRLE